MRKILSPRAHGALDYVSVAVFALAPVALGLEGLPATLAYLLAGVHLLLTLATDFPRGVVSVVPFPVHGLIEAVVGAVLVGLAFVLFDGLAFWLYFGMGAALLSTWAVTDYAGRGRPA